MINSLQDELKNEIELQKKREKKVNRKSEELEGYKRKIKRFSDELKKH